ncbi:MAG: DUF2127 domain-containing protein [Patescibacteria group bacterium]|nr:DUF2127 domain-containing protein [Patescibacteria group bacterium]MDE2014923.1 DUF2127 domain-containing protein [Patescibacteria group bacterium]MDE2226352.1 DUF2127 domain-containing protein [Patescibacteria group bacterium]
MDKISEERGLHDLFEIGVILKGIDGTLEIIGGAFLWFVSPGTLNAIVPYLFRGELIEDPKDWLVNTLLHVTQNLSGGLQTYASIILITHGVVKIFLIAGLLRNKLWAYPAAIVVFIGFIISQLYQLSFQYSLFLWAITIIDVFVVLLIAHEYRHARRSTATVA